MAAEKMHNDKEYSAVAVTANAATDCRLYKRRWLMLGMFMTYAVAAGSQWMQYSIISDVISKYYGVHTSTVEWTTMLHMLSYVICIVPALILLDKAGNRITMLTAGFGVCIGAWIKLYGVPQDRFVYVLIGQFIEAAAQVLTFGLAGSVTATWFGPKEISLAGSLALFGDQFGAALGFVLPPLVVENSDNMEVVGKGLFNLCLIISVFTTAILVFMLIFFTDRPKKLPSNAQIIQKEVRQTRNIFPMLTKMMSQRSFLFMLITYGLHIGVFNALATLLNPVLLHYFPGHNKDAGMIGSLIVCCGLIGAVIGGWFLDWKHLFKDTTLFLYITSTVCMAVYSFYLEQRNLVVVYLMASLLGLSMLGYYSVGLQMAIEITYPCSEGVAAGLMLFAVQFLSIFLTPFYRVIFENYGAFKANLVLNGLLLAGTLLTTIIPPYTKRQDAEKRGKENEAAKAFIINVDT